MTIYIAGAMTGLNNYNRENFYRIEKIITEKGHRALNPAKLPDLPEYDMYWPINKAMIDGADAIYMLDGWIDSPGANKEFAYAKGLGLQRIFEEDDKKGRAEW